MDTLDTYELLQRLSQIALLLEFREENPFRINAYRKAVRALKQTTDLQGLIATGGLTSIQGIGKGLAQEITAIATTGTSPLWDQLSAELPVAGLLEMMGVSGLGPKSARTIYHQLGASSLGELEYACQENRLVELPGFGAKKQAKIQAEIHQIKQNRRLIRYGDAIALAQTLLATWTDTPASVTGKLRRAWEVCEALELVIAAPPEAIATWLARVSDQPLESTPATLQTQIGKIPILCHAATPETYGWKLLQTTGSPEHLAQLGLGAEVPAWALPGWSEAQFYAALELPWIPPQLREGTGEVAAARAGQLPNLVQATEIKGLLHVHSTYSDGANSLEEMVQAAIAQGYEYLGISDHSQAAFYARGLKPPDLRRQHQEIAQLNQKYRGKIQILAGIEADILPDGSLDYAATDPDILNTFDFVIASVHTQLKMPPEAMTARLVTALAHPCVTILGHWTGRILLGREASQFDHEAVLEAAAAHQVALEFNASPYRLDLDWREIRQATSRGVKIAVNPDAHAIAGLADTALTLPVAQKGWLESSQILNCLSAEAFLEFAAKSTRT